MPPGLIYLANYLTADYANRLVDFLTNEQPESENKSFTDLKKRRVKHFGYEFRYGTNDCDLSQPLTDPDKKMPDVCDELISRMLADGHITVKPDQLTVNFYEPGHGIGNLIISQKRV